MKTGAFIELSTYHPFSIPKLNFTEFYHCLERHFSDHLLFGRVPYSYIYYMPHYSFKRQHHKMVKPSQTIRRLLPTNCLSVFDHL